MIYKQIPLKMHYPSLGDNVILEIYLCKDNEQTINNPREAMLVIPGGGYVYCSEREKEPIALRFMAEGFNCFVLTYTCEKPYPYPHNDLGCAMDYINNHFKEFNIQKNHISIVGFSAGGHLCASYGYLYKEIAKNLNLNNENLRPYSIVLGYPVISDLLGDNSRTMSIISSNGDIDKLRCNLNVTSDYPPTYIWTTSEDQCINCKNTLVFIEALKSKNVKYKSHIFPKGEHGGSLANRAVYSENYPHFIDIEENSIWPSEAAKFIFTLKE